MDLVLQVAFKDSAKILKVDQYVWHKVLLLKDFIETEE
jgi:hypothetical protein